MAKRRGKLVLRQGKFLEAARQQHRTSDAQQSTYGKYHNLERIKDKLNYRYFDGELEVTIRWGQLPPPKQQKRVSIRMGSCDVDKRRITIHPALDRVWVPKFFVEWIVYHEMLHVKIPPYRKKGRWQFHFPEFKAEETIFRYYRSAVRWEKRFLNRLLRF